MLNTELIDYAVKLVIDFFEAEGITEETKTIRQRAINWYNMTDIVDAQMLAAATIEGDYQSGLTWDDLLNWKEFYFPSNPIEETYVTTKNYIYNDDNLPLEIENFHISEIEAAQKDAQWR